MAASTGCGVATSQMLDRYKACMVLSGVGDAMGYKRGKWEFCKSGCKIHEELQQLGGLKGLVIERPQWIVSDDTVMHIATAKALASGKVHKKTSDLEKFFLRLAREYIECMNDMDDRAPGFTTQASIRDLNPKAKNGYHIDFDETGGGCGAAMRAMCIGLVYHRPSQLDILLKVSIESGRMTHHHPSGYLGALASALFTAYAIQGKPLNSWGHGLMSVLPMAKEYIKATGRYVDKNLAAWGYFEEQWTKYLELRKITSGDKNPMFPPNFDVQARDAFYSELSFSGWGGASGHDAPMIAYDALLGCQGSWSEFCLRGVLHGGDNDSTGAIGGAWFGALYGFHGVPAGHYQNLEYRAELEKLGEQLHKMSR